jgi:hypothetical protein
VAAVASANSANISPIKAWNAKEASRRNILVDFQFCRIESHRPLECQNRQNFVDFQFLPN